MTKYITTNIGKLDTLMGTENGKVFLHDLVTLTGCEISINCVPKGYKDPFKHNHIQNEEIYIFLKGEGIVTVDDKMIPVQEGSVVKIEPDALRFLENTSESALQFICVQTKVHSLEQYGLGDAKLC